MDGGREGGRARRDGRMHGCVYSVCIGMCGYVYIYIYTMTYIYIML